MTGYKIAKVIYENFIYELRYYHNALVSDCMSRMLNQSISPLKRLSVFPSLLLDFREWKLV
ncbi:uncharacterized protein BO96DRAFT_351502 [Aspergillus niger CBS 101883]|uniref:Uncharacterized protein n=2 Tax=Aspergillus niger TaxID=5061 RepID=A2R931_ASPNC|nr:uncharacterized protein BO96DRAFT_351502 [Aspergillus niger CBS 101883]XP_059604947.1 hypothetical protein An16g09255 [Aspergillus niger]PYH50868.1 hypothetical protein BO96DRAFT_351502 [Aspergillus niger CBS 101883]CAK47122.1 hypothetical protein An16g09255 [Aspergillus niger]